MSCSNKSVLLVTAIIALVLALCGSVSAAPAGSIVAWGSNNWNESTVPAGGDFVAVACGTGHSLALKTDGSLVGWGDNTNGQRDVPAGTGFKAIAAGIRHSLALRSDGSIVAWGDNTYHQTDVPAGTVYTAIAPSCYADVALKSDGSLVAWGQDNYGLITDVPAGTGYKAIAAGFGHCIALKSDGSLVGWGQDTEGECDVPAGNDFVAIASNGGNHSIALRSNGSIVAWGDNSYGQCNVPAGISFTAVAAGVGHSVALKTDGSVLAWGMNGDGQANAPLGECYTAISAGGWYNLALSNGAPSNTSVTPNAGLLAADTYYTFTTKYYDPDGYADLRECELLISPTLSRANAIRVKYDPVSHMIYLRDDSDTSWGVGHTIVDDVTLENSQCRVHLWGFSMHGGGKELTLNWSIAPKKAFVSKKLDVYTRVEDSTSQTAGWDRMGTYAGTGGAMVWGNNDYGQGNIPSDKNLVAISASAYHSLALRSDGSLAAWGNNSFGMIDFPAGTDFAAVDGGVFHSLALKADGSLVAWGANDLGQCNVPPGCDYVAISAGDTHSLALKSDGSISAWGMNTYGQCNPPAGDFVAVSAGAYFSLGLKSDGSIVGWGDNAQGQRNVPAGNDFVAISGGGYHSLALRADGSLVAWGSNNSGACNVPPGNNFVAISAGATHSLALRSDGTVAAWGDNGSGQCNLAGGGFVAISAGSYYYSLAIQDGTPSNISLAPNSGTLAADTPYTLACKYFDGDGFADISKAYLLINDSLGQANAALLMYDRVVNKVYLKNDANSSWGTGYAPGTDVIVQNSQCRLLIKDTVVSGSGSNLAVDWRVSLKSAFTAKNLNANMYVKDASGKSDGWDLMAIYYNVKPQVVSISPNAGALPIDTVTSLVSVYRDVNGYGDLRKIYMVLCEGFSQSNAMLLYYDKAANKLFLKNDANSNWGTGRVLGTDFTLSNSQCEVYVKDTTAVGVGNDLTFTWSFKLKPSMTDKNLYSWMYVTDSMGLSDGWKKMGTHFIPVAPTCVSVTPSTGKVQTGTPLVFSTEYADDNGTDDIYQCWFQMGQTGSLANSVCVMYDKKQNKVFLKNDANTSWGTGYPPGTTGTLENSQCIVYVKDTTVTPSGSDNLIVDWKITLKPTLKGKLLGQRMYCRDNEYMNSAWKLKGTVRGM